MTKKRKTNKKNLTFFFSLSLFHSPTPSPTPHSPPTALHLLEDFADLKPGSTLVQTGATTAVGKLVIQLAASRGVSTVNVVRDRGSAEELAEVKKNLINLGGGGAKEGQERAAGGGERGRVVVLSESEIAAMRSFKDLASSLSSNSSTSSSSSSPLDLAPPSLALNCTGGASASSALRLLKPGSHFVTYGGLSRKPLAVPASALIFRDIRFVGFWLSKGLMLPEQQQQQKKTRGDDDRKDENADNDDEEEQRRRRCLSAALARRRSDLDRVASLVSQGTISTEVEKIPMERWREALAALRKGGVGARKQLLLP